MTRLGILLSGRGSNFQAISDSIEAGRLNAEIAIVLSNREGAAGLQTARMRGLPSKWISPHGIDRTSYDFLLLEELSGHSVDFVCLAGYLRLLSPEFIRAYPQRILNIHPSLLPAFPGLHVQKQALDHGVKVTGCTVHFVSEELDSGPIILQAPVEVLEGDTEQSLSSRILIEEHRLYSEALRIVVSGNYRIEKRKVIAGAGGAFALGTGSDL